MNEFNKIFEATQRANKFGKTLKLLEDKIGEDDSQDVQEALEYLKSLQPVLPQFVIDWTRGKNLTIYTVHFIFLIRKIELIQMKRYINGLKNLKNVMKMIFS